MDTSMVTRLILLVHPSQGNEPILCTPSGFLLTFLEFCHNKLLSNRRKVLRKYTISGGIQTHLSRIVKIIVPIVLNVNLIWLIY